MVRWYVLRQGHPESDRADGDGMSARDRGRGTQTSKAHEAAETAAMHRKPEINEQMKILVPSSSQLHSYLPVSSGISCWVSVQTSSQKALLELLRSPMPTLQPLYFAPEPIMPLARDGHYCLYSTIVSIDDPRMLFHGILTCRSLGTRCRVSIISAWL